MTTPLQMIFGSFVLAACASPQVTAAVASVAPRSIDMRVVVEQYRADRDALGRLWPVDASSRRGERLRAFQRATLEQLERIDFDALDLEGRIDWVLLKHEAEVALRQLDLEEQRWAEIEPLVPYRERLARTDESAVRLDEMRPREAAGELESLRTEVEAAREYAQEHAAEFAKSLANRAAGVVDDLRRGLRRWYDGRHGYDPEFDWWMAKPYEALKDELEGHAKLLRETLAGLKPDDKETIIGDPIGREALLAELEQAMIAYTPEELLEIADREMAWCRERMLDAARRMGCGDDWKQALERVKQDFVPPGEQPELIRRLAEEATAFLEANELVTVPPLAKETWRMDMMSADEQLVTPFFTGGEVINVSFPTDTMTHEQKLMSLRGNNRHFCRATVHHELIPGHHLQQFMTQRYQPHRRIFSTPFWTEGWALWFEMLLWDKGFPESPENEVGMLFWRMHRCARIRFSLSFHLGLWEPQRCIDYLVDEVGHERENATAEVRRSFNGSYGPLYQIAYMVGALQLRALHRELVDSGRTSDRPFHDAVLQGGNMPIEMVRARVSGSPPARDFEARWRFYPLGN